MANRAKQIARFKKAVKACKGKGKEFRKCMSVKLRKK